jgi:hypothetical protein
MPAKKVYKRFMKNFSITRSGFKHIEVNFVDEDHELAAKVVNVAMNKTEEHLRKLYIKINDELANAIAIRKDSLTASLQSTTDSLIAMRVKYGIYDLISPGRKGQTSFTPKSSGAAYAEGLEVIQNLEEIKDRLAMDRAKYLSLYNEFKNSYLCRYTYDTCYPMGNPTWSQSRTVSYPWRVERICDFYRIWTFTRCCDRSY